MEAPPHRLRAGRLQEPPHSTSHSAAATAPPEGDEHLESSKHKGRRRWRRGRGPAVSVVLLTAAVAGGFLLFLSAFMNVSVGPFFPASSSSSSSSSSSKSKREPASLVSTSPHTTEQRKKEPAVDLDSERPPASIEHPKHKQKQGTDKEGPFEPAATLSAFDDAVAAFLQRARMEKVEKQPVPLLAPDGVDGDGDDDPATLPRVAVLYCPTEHAAALALTKALEAALLEDGEAEPMAMDEVLDEGEEDGWIIRVEGHRRALGGDDGASSSSSDAPPSDFLLWFTTRVPPYGYGKSHGLAAVVRLLAFPPHALLEDEVDVRDFVRWHCRVSHVTAHTPTLTLELGSALVGWLGDDDDDDDDGGGFGAGGGGASSIQEPEEQKKGGKSRDLLERSYAEGEEEDSFGAGEGWEARIWQFLGLDPSFLPAAEDALADEMMAAGVSDVFGWLGGDVDDGADDDDDDDEGGAQGGDGFEGEEGVMMDVGEEEEMEEEAIAPELRPVFIEEVGKMTKWPCGPLEASELKPACHLTRWVRCNVPWDVCGKANCEGQEGAAA